MLFHIMPLQFHIRLNPPPPPQMIMFTQATLTQQGLYDAKALKTLNQHIKQQMMHFKRVYQLLEDYRKNQEDDEVGRREQDQRSKEKLKESHRSPHKTGSYTHLQNTNQIFVTEKARKKDYDTLDKTIMLLPTKKKRQSVTHEEIGLDYKDRREFT